MYQRWPDVAIISFVKSSNILLSQSKDGCHESVSAQNKTTEEVFFYVSGDYAYFLSEVSKNCSYIKQERFDKMYATYRNYISWNRPAIVTLSGSKLQNNQQFFQDVPQNVMIEERSTMKWTIYFRRLQHPLATAAITLYKVFYLFFVHTLYTEKRLYSKIYLNTRRGLIARGWITESGRISLQR